MLDHKHNLNFVYFYVFTMGRGHKTVLTTQQGIGVTLIFVCSNPKMEKQNKEPKISTFKKGIQQKIYKNPKQKQQRKNLFSLLFCCAASPS